MCSFATLVVVGGRSREEEIENGYERFTRGLREVYERFTRGLREVYERFTGGLREVYGRFKPFQDSKKTEPFHDSKRFAAA